MVRGAVEIGAAVDVLPTLLSADQTWNKQEESDEVLAESKGKRHVKTNTFFPHGAEMLVNPRRESTKIAFKSAHENFLYPTNLFLPDIHPVVYNWIDRSVGHGEPVYTEVYMFCGGMSRYFFIVVGVQKVDVVGKPADAEDANHYDKHLHHLKVV